MRERPILMSGPLVRAILAGTKTQTRRVVKVRGEVPPTWATFAQELSTLRMDHSWGPSGLFRWSEEQTPGQPWKSLRRWPGHGPDLVHNWYGIPCPYGQPGDRLWVRETWRTFERPNDGTDGVLFQADGAFVEIENSRPAADLWIDAHNQTSAQGGKWRPSIHMPRWASRLTLAVESIRVERLQDISEEDARAEGVEPVPFCKTGRPAGMEHVEAFEDLWQHINGSRPGCSWEANPFCWVVGCSVAEVRS